MRTTEIRIGVCLASPALLLAACLFLVKGLPYAAAGILLAVIMLLGVGHLVDILEARK